jgi:hypothetical protein
VLTEVAVVVVVVWWREVDEVVVAVLEVEVCVWVDVIVSAALLSAKTIWPLPAFTEQEPKLRLLVSPVYPVFTHDGTITVPV